MGVCTGLYSFAVIVATTMIIWRSLLLQVYKVGQAKVLICYDLTREFDLFAMSELHNILYIPLFKGSKNLQQNLCSASP